MRVMNDYKKIYDTAGFTAKKFYKRYSALFFANSYDSSDLEQEAKIRVFETISVYEKKYPNNFEYLFKVCNKAVRWRLLDLKERCTVNFTTSNNGLKLPTRFKESLLPSNIKKYLTPPILIQLSELLSDREYDLFLKVALEGYTFEELSVYCGCSKQRAHQLYKKAVNKAEKFFGY